MNRKKIAYIVFLIALNFKKFAEKIFGLNKYCDYRKYKIQYSRLYNAWEVLEDRLIVNFNWTELGSRQFATKKDAKKYVDEIKEKQK